jgi:hypothetical protein
MNLLDRLENLCKSSHSQSWVSVESHELLSLVAVARAAIRTDDDLRTEYGNRIAEINFGYLNKALAALEQSE